MPKLIQSRKDIDEKVQNEILPNIVKKVQDILEKLGQQNQTFVGNGENLDGEKIRAIVEAEF
jgi:hypothetical protein